MTVTSASTQVDKRDDLVTLTIDDIEVSVPKGTLIIRAAEMIGVQIPRFCDHPLLNPVGACRQCMVEIPDAGNGRGMPKPQVSCTIEVAPGMVVRTQLSSPVAEKAQRGQMEFLLMNHPLDCPVCDKGGECPLQNQAMSNGQAETRFEDVKRTFPKPLPLSPNVLLDRERCVLCARCTRFSNQIAGDPMIEMLERGALQQVGIYEDEPFSSYFSGNTIQICPVGALTSADYRFRSRPFDLVSTPTTCEHCASGCSLRSDTRRGVEMRRQAGDDPDVNEEWSCDKGRFAFDYVTADDRLTHPMVRGDDGRLRVASWVEALRVAAAGLTAAGGKVGVLPGGRLTVEDAYAYSKFARVVLRTNDIDSRARTSATDEELAFLGAGVAASGLGVTYADLEKASAVLLVDFEPEDESPIVFLRLRKAVTKNRTRVFSLATFAARGLTKLGGTLLPTTPGGQAAVLADIEAGADDGSQAVATALRGEGAVILVGERAAEAPGTLAAAQALADATGARLAWIPRRAGERGAIDVGCLPTLLPGGRQVGDTEARVDIGTAWGATVPPAPGRSLAGILSAAAAGSLTALVVGGVDPADLPDPVAAVSALDQVGFLVSLEIRASAVTERADVVFPVAAAAEKPGSYTDWEGRERLFRASLPGTGNLSDLRVLATLADAIGPRLGLVDAASARAELAELGQWDGAGPAMPTVESASATPAAAGDGEAVLASWHELIDAGRMVEGEQHLAATARRAVARVSSETARALGLVAGGTAQVHGPIGELELPVEVEELMSDGVVWLPANSRAGGNIRVLLGAAPGDIVQVTPGPTQGGAA